MKRILSITAILGMAFLFMSAITIFEMPQDPPKKKKTKKHIKVVQVKDGEKAELDTIIEGDNVFVWHGDTLGGEKALNWISKEDFDLDSMDFDFDFDIEEGEDGNVFIFKSDEGGEKMIKEFKMHGDGKFDVIKKGEHGKPGVIMWHNDEGNNEMIIGTPGVRALPHAALAPKAMFFGDRKKGNVIDLSDPGVISFKKKKHKGGREKITIIREEVEETDEELQIHEHIDAPMIWHERAPGKAKTIKIKKMEDGDVEIMEDEHIWNIKEGDENIKVIKEDGKLIHIKEIKKGDKKEVEVKVEVEEETENEKKQ